MKIILYSICKRLGWNITREWKATLEWGNVSEWQSEVYKRFIVRSFRQSFGKINSPDDRSGCRGNSGHKMGSKWLSISRIFQANIYIYSVRDKKSGRKITEHFEIYWKSLKTWKRKHLFSGKYISHILYISYGKFHSQADRETDRHILNWTCLEYLIKFSFCFLRYFCVFLF